MTNNLVKGSLIAWVVFAYTLYPFPWDDAKYFDENRATMQEIVVAEATHQGKRLTEKEIDASVGQQIAIQKTHVWVQWLIRAVAIALGIMACAIYLRGSKKGIASWGVIITSLIYFAVWIAPYASLRRSIFDSYVQVALGAFSDASWQLGFGFVLFNVILPIIQIVTAVAIAVVVLARLRHEPA
jgi:hypothetical protein